MCRRGSPGLASIEASQDCRETGLIQLTLADQ
jgi:hypothetical protein